MQQDNEHPSEPEDRTEAVLYDPFADDEDSEPTEVTEATDATDATDATKVEGTAQACPEATYFC